MASYQDLIVSQRDRTSAVMAMKEAFKVMNAIMRDDLVTSQRGYAYTDSDTDILDAGRRALSRWRAEPRSQAQQILNESALEQAGRAIGLADMMLRRMGFDDVRSAGDDVMDGDVFCDGQKRIVERAYERYRDVTQHGRN